MSIGFASLSAVLIYDRQAQLTIVQYRDLNGEARAQTPTKAVILLLEESAPRQAPSYLSTGRISVRV
jgi:hypothetical protein